jgi:hypothetical protein
LKAVYAKNNGLFICKKSIFFLYVKKTNILLKADIMKYEKNIVIDKAFLKNLKQFSIVFENCESFDIDGEKLTDIYLEAALADEYENQAHYKTDDGKIEIDSSAAHTLSSFYYDYLDLEKENTDIFGEHTAESDDYLSERIRHGTAGGCDICAVYFEMNDGAYFSVYLPYNPLEDTHGFGIELSNCPSVEVKENGNILLLFGKSSKAAKRTDNNFADLIIGWKDFYPKKKKPPKAFKVCMNGIQNLERTGRVPRLFIRFYLLNKQFDYDYLELVFEDYDCLSFDLHSFAFERCEFEMSKLLNGRIFVKSDRFDLSFECACIREYDNYCKRRVKPEGLRGEEYIKAANLEPNPAEMRAIAQDNRFDAGGEAALFAPVFNAVNFLRESKISIDYFKYWLAFYSNALSEPEVYFSKIGKFAADLAELLDKLYANSAYDQTLADIADKLDKFEKKALELQKRYVL